MLPSVLNSDTKIISLRPQNLNDIWEDVRKVACELDAMPAYEEFKMEVDRRINYIVNKISNVIFYVLNVSLFSEF